MIYASVTTANHISPERLLFVLSTQGEIATPRPRRFGHFSRGIEPDEGLIGTYREMNPIDLGSRFGRFRIGQAVRYTSSKSVMQRVWGKFAGHIIEIRGHGRQAGQVVLMVKAPDGSWHFGTPMDFVPA